MENNKIVDKILYILSNTEEKGKTDVLKKFVNNINTYAVSPISNPLGDDFTIDIDVNIRGINDKMGITTIKKLVELDNLKSKGCNIIVCEALTAGYRNEYINWGLQNGYVPIKGITYDPTNHYEDLYDDLNRLNANHIIDILRNI